MGRISIVLFSLFIGANAFASTQTFKNVSCQFGEHLFHDHSKPGVWHNYTLTFPDDKKTDQTGDFLNKTFDLADFPGYYLHLYSMFFGGAQNPTQYIEFTVTKTKEESSEAVIAWNTTNGKPETGFNIGFTVENTLVEGVCEFTK